MPVSRRRAWWASNCGRNSENPMTDSDTLTANLQRLRDAQARDPMPAWPVRRQRLRALETMLRETRETFAAALNADFGQRTAADNDQTGQASCREREWQ